MSLSNEELIKQEMIAVAIMEYRKYMESQNTVTLGSRLHDFQDFVKDTKVASNVFGRISSIFSKGKPNTSSPSSSPYPILDPISGSIPSPIPRDSSSPTFSSTHSGPATTSPTNPISPSTPATSGTSASSGTPATSGKPATPGSSTKSDKPDKLVIPASVLKPHFFGTPASSDKSPSSSDPLKKTIDNNLPKLCGGDKNPKLITLYNLTLIIKPEHFGEIIILSFDQKKLGNNVLIQRKLKGISPMHDNGKKYQIFLSKYKKDIPKIDKYKILSVADTRELIKGFTNSDLKIIGGYYQHGDIISSDKMKNIDFDKFIQEINSGSDKDELSPPTSK